MRSIFIICCLCLINAFAFSQYAVQWKNIDSLYQPLPRSVHVFFTEQKIDTAPFRAFYIIADLKDKNLDFTTDTTYKRRLTPMQFYQKNNQPLIVVNGTFFSFETNQNLNIVVKDGRILSYNVHSIPRKGKDTFTYNHLVNGAIGISKKRKADVAWILSDSSKKKTYPSQWPVPLSSDSIQRRKLNEFRHWAMSETAGSYSPFMKTWDMK